MTAALEIADFSVFHGRRRVIDSVSLPPIAAGQLVALIGPNAAGKSTLLRGLAGLLPSSGSARVDGQDIARLSRAARARQVAYMPQALPADVTFTVLESTILSLEASGYSSAKCLDDAVRTLAKLDLLSIADTPLDRLSGGQRQLAALAQTLAREPRAILLDEPTSALDLRRQLQVLSLVRDVALASGAVVLLVLHDLSLACRWADVVCLLNEGCIAAAGAPEQAVTPAMLRAVYGIDADVHRGRDGRIDVVVLDVASSEK